MIKIIDALHEKFNLLVTAIQNDNSDNYKQNLIQLINEELMVVLSDEDYSHNQSQLDSQA